MPKKPISSVRQRAVAAGYRSGLEESVATALSSAGVSAGYEERKLRYTKPATSNLYTPDFCLPNGIVIETKGVFTADDRKKHLLIKDQHPGIDLRFVFGRSKNRLTKVSQTTYASWCEKHGFLYADVRVPLAWIHEPPDESRIQALNQATNSKK